MFVFYDKDITGKGLAVYEIQIDIIEIQTRRIEVGVTLVYFLKK